MNLESSFQLIIAFLYSLVVSFIIAGLRRKSKARMQGRIGPPVWQPFCDFLKLLLKEVSLPSSSSLIFLFAPVTSLVLVIVASFIVPVPGLRTISFSGDIPFFVILIGAVDFVLLMGGISTGNPYSWISFSRSTILAIIREIFFIASVIVLIVKAQEFSFYEAVFNSHVSHILKISISIFFLIYSLGVSVTTVFSAPLAETEILEGIFIEYSGPLLAFAELTHMLLTYVVLSLSSTLFVSTFVTGAPGIIFHFILVVIFTFLISYLDSVFARLKIGSAVKIYSLLLAVSTGCVIVSLLVG